MTGLNGKNKKNRLRFPVSSISSEEFDDKLHKIGAEVFPFSLFLGVKKQWCVVAHCEEFLKEIKAEIEKRKSINNNSLPKVRKKDNEYYYFNDDVVVITKVK